VLADEGDHVGGALDAGEAEVEDELGDAGGGRILTVRKILVEEIAMKLA
jgi:hypothetical protein